MSCSHYQELCQQSSWLLIAKKECTTNQKLGQQVDPTLDFDNNSKVSTPGVLLALGGVEGDAVAGICTAGVRNTVNLVVFVTLPLLIYLILGNKTFHSIVCIVKV